MATKKIFENALIGGSVAWNQLCDADSVTVTNKHKYYMIKGGTRSIGASTGAAITGLTSGTDMVTDLTLMFGTTIADYAYNLEQSSAGSGVAWLQSYGFFTEDYYPYDAGTLKHVQATAHVMRDATEQVIGRYPYDSSLTLRGIPKLDSEKLYYDGDRYQSDGTVTRKYGIVDLGTLSWTIASTGVSGANRFVTYLPSSQYIKPKQSDTTSGATSICRYLLLNSGGTFSASADGYTIVSSGDIYFYIDTYKTATAATFKSAMSGVYLVYELATTTTESATPFTSAQLADTDGTEEYVTTNDIPVGHETMYPIEE